MDLPSRPTHSSYSPRPRPAWGAGSASSSSPSATPISSPGAGDKGGGQQQSPGGGHTRLPSTDSGIQADAGWDSLTRSHHKSLTKMDSASPDSRTPLKTLTRCLMESPRGRWDSDPMNASDRMPRSPAGSDSANRTDSDAKMTSRARSRTLSCDSDLRNSGASSPKALPSNVRTINIEFKGRGEGGAGAERRTLAGEAGPEGRSPVGLGGTRAGDGIMTKSFDGSLPASPLRTPTSSLGAKGYFGSASHLASRPDRLGLRADHLLGPIRPDPVLSSRLDHLGPRLDHAGSRSVDHLGPTSRAETYAPGARSLDHAASSDGSGFASGRLTSRLNPSAFLSSDGFSTASLPRRTSNAATAAATEDRVGRHLSLLCSSTPVIPSLRGLQDGPLGSPQGGDWVHQRGSRDYYSGSGSGSGSRRQLGWLADEGPVHAAMRIHRRPMHSAVPSSTDHYPYQYSREAPPAVSAHGQPSTPASQYHRPPTAGGGVGGGGEGRHVPVATASTVSGHATATTTTVTASSKGGAGGGGASHGPAGGKSLRVHFVDDAGSSSSGFQSGSSSRSASSPLSSPSAPPGGSAAADFGARFSASPRRQDSPSSLSPRRQDWPASSASPKRQESPLSPASASTLAKQPDSSQGGVVGSRVTATARAESYSSARPRDSDSPGSQPRLQQLPVEHITTPSSTAAAATTPFSSSSSSQGTRGGPSASGGGGENGGGGVGDGVNGGGSRPRNANPMFRSKFSPVMPHGHAFRARLHISPSSAPPPATLQPVPVKHVDTCSACLKTTEPSTTTTTSNATITESQGAGPASRRRREPTPVSANVRATATPTNTTTTVTTTTTATATAVNGVAENGDTIGPPSEATSPTTITPPDCLLKMLHKSVVAAGGGGGGEEGEGGGEGRTVPILDLRKEVPWSERRNRIDSALAWLKSELASLRDMDTALVTQFKRCQDTIESLKQQQQQQGEAWGDGEGSEWGFGLDGSELDEEEDTWEDWEIAEFDKKWAEDPESRHKFALSPHRQVAANGNDEVCATYTLTAPPDTAESPSDVRTSQTTTDSGQKSPSPIKQDIEAQL